MWLNVLKCGLKPAIPRIADSPPHLTLTQSQCILRFQPLLVYKIVQTGDRVTDSLAVAAKKSLPAMIKEGGLVEFNRLSNEIFQP